MTALVFAHATPVSPVRSARQARGSVSVFSHSTILLSCVVWVPGKVRDARRAAPSKYSRPSFL